MPSTKEDNCDTTFLREKIIQNCLKIDEKYDNDSLLRKKMHVLEAGIIVKKYSFDARSSKDELFPRRVPNDHHCVCLSNKSLLY